MKCHGTAGCHFPLCSSIVCIRLWGTFYVQRTLWHEVTVKFSIGNLELTWLHIYYIHLFHRVELRPFELNIFSLLIRFEFVFKYYYYHSIVFRSNKFGIMKRQNRKAVVKTHPIFKKNECVIAHMKTYAPWPAFITKVDGTKVSVIFFGDRSVWVHL